MNPVRPLSRDFFARPTLDVAGDLIGKVLVHDTPAGRSAGRIVEVEAYIGEDDPACHAAPGPTRRNEPLYGTPGVAYVYLNYGVHFLTNVVAKKSIAQPRFNLCASHGRTLTHLSVARQSVFS